MKRISVILLISCCVVACSISVGSYRAQRISIPAGSYEDTLRFLYSLDPAQWPAPFIDPVVQWKELAMLPDSPLKPFMDSLEPLIDLGKVLFFDRRLSGSNKIACASCHIPELSWTDGRVKSLGHEDQSTKRNSPTLLNVWYYGQLFWDGRSKSLEDQAFSPINSETEMHSDMAEVMMKLRRISGYKLLFDSAFGRPEISPETVTVALAAFQRTLVSNKSNFDQFLAGKKDALSEPALRGLHLFRTKARCMNCHNGALFTDNSFHNTGLARYGQPDEDLGRYTFTRRAEDIGRFKTPGLRDVLFTRPWMHNGLIDDLEVLMNMYNAGMPQAGSNPGLAGDSLFPKTDPLIRRLGLNSREKQDLIAFLRAISSAPPAIQLPQMPR